MITNPPGLAHFKKRLVAALQQGTLKSVSLKFSKREVIYNYGDQSQTIYFIESGYVKLLTISETGKECLIFIYTSGDLFGETHDFGSGARQETAETISDATLRSIPRTVFLMELNRESLVEGFIEYLAARIAERQQSITNLLLYDSEHRLGWVLLRLAQRIGKSYPRGVYLGVKISHEEFSAMVGTTRPRITHFIRKFHQLGLIETNQQRHLLIRQDKLYNYLTHPR